MATNLGAAGNEHQALQQQPAAAAYAQASLDGGPAPTVQSIAGSAFASVKAQIAQRLDDWVTGAAPPLGAGADTFAWFLSKRAAANINKWLGDTKLAALTPVSPAGTGCIVVSREAAEHCRDHRAAEGVSQVAVIELLTQLFVNGNPSYAPNTSKGPTGKGYIGQLVMFDASYKALDATAAGESACGILQHEVSLVDGVPFVQLALVTAYWTKPKGVEDLKRFSLTGAPPKK